MSAEVETMMFVGRERPWHGLGTMVEEAPDSREKYPAVTEGCYRRKVTTCRKKPEMCWICLSKVIQGCRSGIPVM
ncbi:MAG: hypothetical protein MR965_03900 [Lachnospiraceae bacterium]|nr:hypothetical protein [Lachnospiraceae bacterium]